MAYFLSTTANSDKRDEARALILAKESVSLTSRLEAAFLAVEANCHAALGDFDSAKNVIDEAIEIAVKNDSAPNKEFCEKWKTLFENGKAFSQ